MPDSEHLAARLRAAGLVEESAIVNLTLHRPAYPRAPECARWSYRVVVGGVARYHLTVAADLSDSATRARDFAQACPAIACRVLAYLHDATPELLVGEHFDGESLDELVLRGDCSAQDWLAATRSVRAVLEATDAASDPAALRAEIDSWVQPIQTLGAIPAADLARLAAVLHAPAAAGLRTQWTNGDFTGGNVLLDRQGDVRLVDPEFATRTHFPANDWRRLLQFSVLPNGVNTDSVPECAPHRHPAADIAFWLQHLALLARAARRLPENDGALILRHLGNAYYLLTGTRLEISCRC